MPSQSTAARRRSILDCESLIRLKKLGRNVWLNEHDGGVRGPRTERVLSHGRLLPFFSEPDLAFPSLTRTPF
jgi:hypothetical protein